jgi:alpha-mannosidase
VLILGGSGDYSLAPLRRENPTEFLQQWASLYPDREIRFATLSKYVDALMPALESHRFELPTVRGGTSNTYDSFWIQCPQVKSWFRRDEHALQAAESLATMASLKTGCNYPVQNLYHAWLQMLLNMDRNTLWGAAGGMVFESDTSWDVRDRLEWVEQQSRAALEAAAQELLGTGKGAGLFNPANWKRKDIWQVKLPPGTRLAGASCEAADDGMTLCRLDLPPMGFAGVELLSYSLPVPIEVPLPPIIETAFYSARIDPGTGALVSLKLKPSGREILGGPANVVVAEQHKGQGSEDPGDFTAPRPERRRLASSSDFEVKLRVREGPLAVTVEAQSKFYGGGFCRRLTRFYKDYARIDFETELTDIPNLTVVLAEFPLAQSPQEVRRGIPFGFSHGAWAQPNAELTGWTKGIVPAVRWTDYALPGRGGVALLDRGLTGREINGQTPILYLCNAMDTYYGLTNSWLSGKSRHRFEYALLPHDADWKAAGIPQLAWEYNCPVKLALGCGPAPAQSLIQTSDNLIVEVVRREGAEIEMRLGECLGMGGTAEVTLNLPHEQAALTDLIGGHPTNLEGGPTYKFSVRPQQIITLRFRTRAAVAAIQPLLDWDDLVPPAKRAALRHYLKDAKGHPPVGR